MAEEQKSDFLQIQDIIGIDEAIKIQKEKLTSLREKVRPLTFKKIDIAGSYTSITFKAIDGGKMNISFDPFEINLIEVADSNFKNKLKFVVPEIKSYGNEIGERKISEEITKKIDGIPIINRFMKLLKKRSISEVSYILNDSDNLMEIAEWACIFDRVMADVDDEIVIIKDGLLRTKALKDTLITQLLDVLDSKKEHVKLIGVSKTSAILSLISTAVHMEKKIPPESIGYIKIPLDLELEAYKWTGSGKVDKVSIKPLDFAFGNLYVAKLATNSNLLVTIEVPKIYTENEFKEIVSFLAKDSKHSYPSIGYPQTIMRAHEAAARLGFSASIIKDEIRDKALKDLDDDVKSFVRDSWLIIDVVDKGILGGGKYG